MTYPRLLILLVFIGSMLTVLVFSGQQLLSVNQYQLSQDPTTAGTTTKDDGTENQMQSTVVVDEGDKTGGSTSTGQVDDGSGVIVKTVDVDDATGGEEEDEDASGKSDPITGDEKKEEEDDGCAVVGPVEGSLVHIDQRNICVRAANPDDPSNRPFASVYIGGYKMASARTAENGLVQFDYHALAQQYQGQKKGYQGRAYELAVTVIDPETREEFEVFSTKNFLFPDYDLEAGELQVSQWLYRRTGRRKGTLCLWMTSHCPGRACYRIVGDTTSRKGLQTWTGKALARNEGSDVFYVELKDYPACGRDLPRLAVADRDWQPKFSIPLAQGAFYGKGPAS